MFKVVEQSIQNYEQDIAQMLSETVTRKSDIV
jgi:hypothetical protein